MEQLDWGLDLVCREKEKEDIKKFDMTKHFLKSFTKEATLTPKTKQTLGALLYAANILGGFGMGAWGVKEVGKLYEKSPAFRKWVKGKK